MKRKSIVFPIILEPFEEQVVEVRYNQRLLGNQAVYIVTSTQKWFENLRNAKFEIFVSKKLYGIDISYEVDECDENADYLIYRFSRTDFMPNKDLVITWSGECDE
jgi:hypothetical protein